MQVHFKGNFDPIGICDGAHLYLYVGGTHSQRDTPHKEFHGDRDKNSLSLIQFYVLIISPSIFKLKEFDHPTLLSLSSLHSNLNKNLITH